MKKAADVYQELCLQNETIPDVFEFLASQEGLSDRDQVAVMLVDQFQRWQQNQVIPVDLYLEQTPDVDDVLKVDLLIEEYGYLEQRSIAPSAIEFAKRFRNLSTDARNELLEALEIEPNTAGLDSGSAGSDSLSTGTSSKSEPELIGRYEVIRLLGKGSFGKVFLARDPDLDRSVAIKVPNNHYLEMGGGADEFLAEAKSVAKLDHSNIVPVYDCGLAGDGRCFVVSKFIRGKELNAEIRKGIQQEDATRIASTIARALHVAHAAGIVHRDVKPSNILIDAKKQPHLLDFGLARREFANDESQALIGTPAYMSPEQAKREGHRVDGRSDIYSLGVVLYEMLTGHRPFQGSSEDVLLEQVKHGEVPPPRQSDDSIPVELERICLKALSRDLSQRYNTAKDLADDLDSFLDRNDAVETTQSHRLLSSDKAGTIPDQPSFYQPAMFVGMLALVSVLGAIAWFGSGYGKSSETPGGEENTSVASEAGKGQNLKSDQDVSRNHRLLVLRFRSDSADQNWLATGLTELLTEELGKSADLEVISAEVTQQVQKDLDISGIDSLGESTLKRLNQRIGPRWIVLGSLRPSGSAMDHVDANLTLIDNENNSLKKLVSENNVTENLLKENVPEWAAGIRECLNLDPLDLTRPGIASFSLPAKMRALQPFYEGLGAYRQFNFDTAGVKLAEAHQLDPDSPIVLFRLSELKLAQGDEESAREYAQQAANQSDSLTPDREFQVQGHHFLLQGKPVKACALLQEWVRLDPSNVEATVSLARAMTAAGRGGEALELLNSLIERAHPVELPPLQLAAAEAAQTRSEYQLQLELSAEAAKIAESIGAQRTIGMAALSQGEALRRLGKHDEAERAFDTAVKRLDAFGDSIHAAKAVGAWGKALVDNGELETAEVKINDAMERSKACNNRSLIALHLGQLGELDVYRGKFEDAGMKLKNAADEFAALGNRKRQADMNLTLANVVARQGNKNRAIELIGTAREAFQASGDRRGEARTWGQQGAVHGRDGEIEEAGRHFRRAMELFKEVGDSRGEVTCMGDLATTQQALGQLSEAGELYSTALEIHKRMGSKRGPAMIRYNLGGLYVRLGRIRESVPLIEASLKEFEEQGNHMNACFVQRRLGELYLAHGDIPLAKATLEAALQQSRKLGSPNVEAASLASLANVALEENKTDQAFKYFQQSREIRLKLKQPSTLAALDFDRARAFIRSEKNQEALEILERDTKALVLSKPEWSAAVLAIRAQAEAKLGKSEQAKTSLKKAKEASESHETKDLNVVLATRLEINLAEVALATEQERPVEANRELTQKLDQLVLQCRKQGDISQYLRARLCQVEMLDWSGKEVSSHARELEKDAKEKHFLKIASKAKAFVE